jgi:hypothetical protein
MKVPLGGGTPTALVSNVSYPRAIVVDSTSVYMTTGAGDILKVTPK